MKVNVGSHTLIADILLLGKLRNLCISPETVLLIVEGSSVGVGEGIGTVALSDGFVGVEDVNLLGSLRLVFLSLILSIESSVLSIDDRGEEGDLLSGVASLPPLILLGVAEAIEGSSISSGLTLGSIRIFFTIFELRGRIRLVKLNLLGILLHEMERLTIDGDIFSHIFITIFSIGELELDSLGGGKQQSENES